MRRGRSVGERRSRRRRRRGRRPCRDGRCGRGSCETQAAVVDADGQLEQPVALGVGGRVAAGLPAAVDLDGEVDVLAGAQGRSGREGRVGFEGEGDAAGGLPADRDHLGAGVAQRPGRLDELGVAVDAVRSGEQVYQGRAQHSVPEARRQSLSEHVYTVRLVAPNRQWLRAGCGRFHNSEQSYAQFTIVRARDVRGRRAPGTHCPARSARRPPDARSSRRRCDLLEERSFSALSLREVTREAGIVPAAFYRHFDSMEALGLVLIDESFRALRDMLRGARAGKLDPNRVIESIRRHPHRRRQRAARTLALHRPRTQQRRYGAALCDPHRDSADHLGAGDRPGPLPRAERPGAPRTSTFCPACSSTR